ncbi:MAG: polysaccharide biosynthesis protein, partial [Cytophagales bacterium]|nr:polysaccharide biosynthesis protein [Cytophagales bacterium]
KTTTFSVVRYGNVAGSRGSVIPFFHKLVADGVNELPITDYRMTRFWITLDEAVDLVFKAIGESKGGETYISKIPSFKITDLAAAMLPKGGVREVGIREGEKLHEVMVTEYDSFHTYEYDNHYIVYPSSLDWWDHKRILSGGKKVDEFFEYSSGNNHSWLTTDDIRERINDIDIVY